MKSNSTLPLKNKKCEKKLKTLFSKENDWKNYFAFSDIRNREVWAIEKMSQKWDKNWVFWIYSGILLLSFPETVLKWMFILFVMSLYKSHVCKNGIQVKVLLANQIVEFLNQLYLYNKTKK